MKLLVLHSELGVLRGGGENFSRRLFPAFAERGHRVVAAFTADPGGSYPLPLPAGIEPVPLRGRWSSNFGQEALSTIGRYVPWRSGLRTRWDRVQESLAWRTFAWHKRRFQRRIATEFAPRWTEFDAVYVHSDVELASQVARHRPTVLRLPGPTAQKYESLLRVVNAVCANGDAFARARGFLGDHVTELPIGLDTQAFAPGRSNVRSDLGWGDHLFVAGYVGRLTHLKGVDLLAAAFRELARDAPHARLLMVGGGEEERHVRAVLAKEASRGIVHIEPGVNPDRLPQWYRAMDLMVMPSRYENHSNALIEAMACGVPFLASNVGGNRALCQTGAGWLFESESILSLTHGLRQIMENRSELEARRAVSADIGRRHQTWAASAERLEEILSSRLGVTA